MSAHPYRALPPFTRWSKAVAEVPPGALDPLQHFPFRLAATDRVATAGSCFAQHIARQLRESGFNYYVVEEGHPIVPPDVRERYQYGVYSARYGNVYTARQLLQLIQRAMGVFSPEEDVWRHPGGGFADPFRPNIQPDGFQSIEELRADREQHLAAVRRMFETLDCFVFTFGLTEAWEAIADGAVFPVCPGVYGGEFDPARYRFRNASAGEVVADFQAFLALFRKLNPRAKVIVTVSPVPLVATAENRHVLVSTTYSKAALRVACEELTRSDPDVAYFPSYEIITGAYAQGRYFAPDLRSVTEEGVAHVMRVFFRHVTDGVQPVPALVHPPREDAFAADMNAVIAAICEEELIESALRTVEAPIAPGSSAAANPPTSRSLARA